MSSKNKLVITEYDDIRVLTTQQLAEAYGTEARMLSNNFNRNKEKYFEGKHYICLQGEELQEFKTNHQFDESSRINKLYLWTEKGAFLHAKSLNTDKAWEVYDRLIDSYFEKELPKVPTSTSGQIRILAQGYTELEVKVDTVEKKVDHLENTMVIDYAQQKQLKKLVSEVVTNTLGGKDAKAYRYRDESGKSISKCVFSRFWHDFYDYFGINAYANLPKVRFNEALEYINRWQPSTNMQLEIGAINRKGKVDE